MRSLLICTALLASVGIACADPPRCTKSLLGKFWPEEANNDPIAAAQFARNGELQVCSHKDWRYRWMLPAVRVDQLKGKKWKHPSMEGEADRQKQDSVPADND